MKPISSIPQYLIAGIALVSASFGLWSNLPNWSAPREILARPASAIDYFASLNLEAKAVFVYEPDTGRVLYAKEAGERLPIASVTKLMTALTASELLPDSTIIPLARRRYHLKDLVALTLVSSSNQGAMALSSATAEDLNRDLVSEMNTEAGVLGLKQTTFSNPTGLDLADGQAGSYSTAYDIAHLFTHILAVRPELLAATRFEEIETATVEGVRHRFQNTNEIIGELSGVLGSKTGFTDIAEGSLVIAFDRGLNQPVVVVVLGSSEQGRFSDVKQLVEATVKTFLPTTI
jgi:D-alanyl-D-alanine carboxypeptidase